MTQCSHSSLLNTDEALLRECGFRLDSPPKRRSRGQKVYACWLVVFLTGVAATIPLTLLGGALRIKSLQFSRVILETL